MGCIRFLLASIVIMVHANASLVPSIRIPRRRADLFIVSGFYISGFHIAATYQRNYSGDYRDMTFLAGRFIRLYPTYLTVLLSLGELGWRLVPDRAGLGSPTISAPMARSLISPHGHCYSGHRFINEPDQLVLPVRQAWSISAELAFYAFVPLLMRWKAFALPVAVAGFALKAALFYTGGWRYAYSPFFAEFGYFAFGFWLFQIRERLTWERPVAIAIAIAFCVYALCAGTAGWEISTTVRNMVLVAATALMLPSCFEHLNGRGSRFFGDISCGTYIVQFLALAVLIDVGVIDRNLEGGFFDKLGRLVAVLALSAIVSTLIEVTIQSRIDAWRRGWRRSSRRTLVDLERAGSTVITVPGIVE